MLLSGFILIRLVWKYEAHGQHLPQAQPGRKVLWCAAAEKASPKNEIKPQKFLDCREMSQAPL